MVIHRHYFIILLLLSCFVQVSAQSQSGEIKDDIDSFSRLLATNSDSAHHYIKKAYHKSVVLKNDSLIARTSYNLGYYYYLKSDIVRSKYYLKKAREFSKKSNFRKILSLSYNQEGTIATDENQIEKALKLYLIAYELAEKNDLHENKSRVLINLGNLYVRQKDTLKGLSYYNQNIRNAIRHNLDNELISGYINTAILYSHSDKNKAILYYNKALLIAQKNKNLYSEYSLHINLSELFLGDRNLQKVYYHLQKAKHIQQQLDDPTLLFFLNFNFGGYYKNKKQFSSAIEYYKKALTAINKKTPADQILNLYHAISETYTQINDYKSALLFKQKQSKLSDSIFTINRNKAFTEIQTKYEVDKKNLKIQLLIKEKIIQNRKRQILLSIGGIVVFFLIIVLFFYRQRVKTQRIIAENENKLHKQEVIRLENEKELKRIIGVVEGQDKERNRLAQEIHDGIGGALAGIKLELSQVNSTLRNDKVHQILVNMTSAFNDLRSISHNLSLNYLKEKDFDFLVNKLRDEYRNRGEFDTELIIFPENSLNVLPQNVRQQLYRIVQELFANISKHANADKVILSFTKFDDALNLIVEDNGLGFAPSKEPGIGLRNIQERLSILGGRMTIESNIGRGTSVIIDIPIQETDKP